MICCLPFTYLPGILIDTLTGFLGPLMLLRPLEKPVPLHMQERVDGGTLQLFSPAGIDGERIEQAMQAFTSWAALHGGKPGELKRFFQASQGVGQWRQGPPTNEIRAQIHSELQGEKLSPQVDALFQASFFLALAHRYDQQQEDLAADLGSVQSLETRFGEVLGESADRKRSLGPDLTASALNGASADPGGFMTARRLDAWARLTANSEVSASLFVSTSRAVWELLSDSFPEMRKDRTVKLSLEGQESDDRGNAQEQLADALAALVRSDDPAATSLDQFDALEDSEDAGASLTLRVLEGVTPQEMIARLIDEQASAAGMEKVGHVKNTVIGYVAVPPMRV